MAPNNNSSTTITTTTSTITKELTPHYIVVGLFIVAVVLCILVLVLCCCLKRRKSSISYTALISESASQLKTKVIRKPSALKLNIVQEDFQKNDDEAVSPRKSRIYSTPLSPTTPFGENLSPYSCSSLTSLNNGKESRDVGQLWKLAVRKANSAHLLGGGGSMATTRGGDAKVQCANGKVKFCLVYNKQSKKELTVKILEFVDLPLSRETGYTIPFVKVYLYPQVAHVMEGMTNNMSVETMCFPQENTRTFLGHSYEKLCACAVKLVVLDYDRFSRSEFVAECVVLLDEVSLDGDIITRHLSIQRIPREEDLGSLLISLCYQRNTSRVCIIVLKASGLPDIAGGGHVPDHYVKISLMRGGSVVDKRRTKTMKKSVCPVFNEMFMFPVQCGEDVRTLVLVLDVVRYDNKLKQEKIASVVLGNHTVQRQVTPHEIQHFNEMLASPHRQIAEWHKLVR